MSGSIDLEVPVRETVSPVQALMAARERLRRTGDPIPLVLIQFPSATLDDFQLDLIRSIFNPRIREVYCKGCTASGKTAAVGLAVCLWIDDYTDGRVVLDGPVLGDTAAGTAHGGNRAWDGVCVGDVLGAAHVAQHAELTWTSTLRTRVYRTDADMRGGRLSRRRDVGRRYH